MPSSGRSSIRKPNGIKEIALALDVSIGTVDRALHDRPGINPMTRARVLKMAETMGYRPNLAARYLKSRKGLLFTVILPQEVRFFFDALRRGIRDAASPFEPGVTVQFLTHPLLGEGDSELMEQAIREGSSGIIVCPGDPAALKPLIRKAALKHIPVVCVATDAPGTDRVTAISADPFTSGAVAGELLCRLCGPRAEFAVVTGQLSTVDHAVKLTGFRKALKDLAPDTRLCDVVESHDDAAAAYRQTKEILHAWPGLRGIYVSTANSLPVLEAVEESGRAAGISVITTDLFQELVPYIRSGAVVATMYQRPFTQGRLALQALYQFVVEGRCPAPQLKLAPHVVMRSSLDLFLKWLPTEADTVESDWSSPLELARGS